MLLYISQHLCTYTHHITSHSHYIALYLRTVGIIMSVEFYRVSSGKFDSRILRRETLSWWTGRIASASSRASLLQEVHTVHHESVSGHERHCSSTGRQPRVSFLHRFTLDFVCSCFRKRFRAVVPDALEETVVFWANRPVGL